MHYKNIIFIIIFLLSLYKSSIADLFVSIKSTTNLRAGPGKNYPINWTLTLQNLPVKILEKGDTYSKVELHDGTIGWIWNATESGTPGQQHWPRHSRATPQSPGCT